MLFLTDIFPTGYMGAEMCDITPGDTIAVWGAGPVGQFAAASAVPARRPPRRRHRPLRLPARHRPAQHRRRDAQLRAGRRPRQRSKEITAGRGPDAVIDCVGLEAHHSNAALHAYDRVKQATRAETDRGHALRQMITSVRSGGIVSIVGVYGGFMDKFPIGSLMNRSLTVRTGQTHVHRYQHQLLERIERGEIDPSFIITHRASLSDAPKMYETVQAQAGRVPEGRPHALTSRQELSLAVQRRAGPADDGAEQGGAACPSTSGSR